jgi:hypothetical protein
MQWVGIAFDLAIIVLLIALIAQTAALPAFWRF